MPSRGSGPKGDVPQLGARSKSGPCCRLTTSAPASPTPPSAPSRGAGLGPGDTRDIHWPNGPPYYEKLLISESGTASAPINIVGVPGPNGQQPIIDGDNATTSSQFQYFYNPIQEDGLPG